MATIFIAGKELPDTANFIKGFELHGDKIFTTIKPETEISFEGDSVSTNKWNRASLISTKSILIQAETKLDSINNVVIFFDSKAFASDFSDTKIEFCTEAIENMISSYVYLCQLLLNRIEQKPGRISICFLLKKSEDLPPLVSIAQDSFISIAQNYSKLFYKIQSATPFLVSAEENSELAGDERELGSWLASYFDGLNSLKNKPGEKTTSTWIKAGSKAPSNLFSFLKK